MTDVNDLKVTPRTRWSFASGGITRGVFENAHYFVLVYYSQALGLSPHLAGLAFGIGLVFDAITDPLVGYLSDNMRRDKDGAGLIANAYCLKDSQPGDR